jgi:hypothetical protein
MPRESSAGQALVARTGLGCAAKVDERPRVRRWHAQNISGFQVSVHQPRLMQHLHARGASATIIDGVSSELVYHQLCARASRWSPGRSQYSYI